MIRPPRIARTLLRLSVPRDARDAIDGDLAELYVARADARGRASAALWYWKEVLSFSVRFSLDRLRRSARTVGWIDDPTAPDERRRDRATAWFESLGADLHFALKLFARRPLSSTTIVIVLAIGIAGCATAYGLLQSAIMRPPPGVPSDASLVLVRRVAWQEGQPLGSRSRFAYPTLRAMSEQRSVFSAVAGWTESMVRVDASGALDGASVKAQFVTDGYFGVVGVRPAYGSTLPRRPADAEPQLDAVISESMWEDVFARNDVINRMVMMNDVAVRIVGVAPPRFHGILPGDDARLMVWLPLSSRGTILRTAIGTNPPAPGALSSVDSCLFEVVGRLRPGVSPKTATAAVRVIAANALRQMTPRRMPGFGAAMPPTVYDVDVVSLQGSTDAVAVAFGIPPGPGLIGILSLFGTLATLLLVVVCTNVGALVVSSSVERRAEIAVRLSLGASRARVIRQLLTESITLGALGGAAGIVTLWGVTAALRRIPVAAFFRPDLGTVVFTLGIAVGTGILCGLAPALHATRGGVAAALKDTTTGASRRSRLHRTFIVVQVMVTQPLLMFVGMMIESAQLDVKQPLLGDIPERILKLRVASMPGSATDRAHALERLEMRIAQTAGVTSVMPAPFAVGGLRLSVRSEDRGPTDGADDPVSTQVRLIAPRYFDLIGVPLLRGNDIATASDTTSVIIGSNLARRLWGDMDPIGRRFAEVSPSQAVQRDLVVRGVYDSRFFDQGQPDLIFRPSAKLRTGEYLIRTAVPASTLTDSVRRIVREELPLAQIGSLTTMAQFEAEVSRTARAINAALAASGALVLFLSALGLYGSVALGVRQRRREIGVRMALGARAAQVVRSFYADGVRLGIIGLLLGLPLSVAASNLLEQHAAMEHALVGAVIVLLVLAVASVATLIPAARAARVNPVISLQSE